MLSVTEIENMLLDESEEEYGYRTWAHWAYRDNHPISIDGLGQVKVIEDFGGEGMGDQRYLVFRIDTIKGARYFRIDGYYSSYGGSEWDGDFYEVVPKVVQKTVYQSI